MRYCCKCYIPVPFCTAFYDDHTVKLWNVLDGNLLASTSGSESRVRASKRFRGNRKGAKSAKDTSP